MNPTDETNERPSGSDAPADHDAPSDDELVAAADDVFYELDRRETGE